MDEHEKWLAFETTDHGSFEAISKIIHRDSDESGKVHSPVEMALFPTYPQRIGREHVSGTLTIEFSRHT